MKDNIRISVLKTLSFASVFSFLYPLLFIFRSKIFNVKIEYSYIMFDILIFLLGILGSTIILRRLKLIILKIILFVALFALTTAITVAFTNQTGRTVFELIYAYLFLLVGFKSALGTFESILNNTTIGFGALFLVAAYVFNAYFIFNFSGFISVFAYIFFITVMMVRNQSNIDRVFLKMNSKLSSGVTKNLRIVNITYVIALFIVTLLLFNLQFIFYFVLKILTIFRNGILWLMLEFMSLFQKDMGDIQNGKSSLSGFDDSGKSNGFVSIIEIALMIFALAAAAFIIYKLLPYAIRQIKKVTMILKEFLNRFFSNSKQANGVSEDYSDEIEQIDYTVNDEIAEKAKVKYPKRNLKNLKKISDPVKKVRFLYLLILDELIKKDINIDKADTTGEILKKALPNIGVEEGLRNTTRSYENVRYGDTLLDKNEYSKVENNFINLIKKINN